MEYCRGYCLRVCTLYSDVCLYLRSSAVLTQTILKYTGVALPIKAAVVIVACLVAAIVWYSSLWVGRITTILIFGKFIAFFATFSGLVAHVEIANLLDSASVAIRNEISALCSDDTAVLYYFVWLPR